MVLEKRNDIILLLVQLLCFAAKHIVHCVDLCQQDGEESEAEEFREDHELDLVLGTLS